MKKNHNNTLICILALLVASCSLNTGSHRNDDNKLLVFAHRASSGLWMQNSRNAVMQTVALFSQENSTVDGIEVDIVLTKDHIPVLSHDPWIHTELCVRVDGAPLERTLIKNKTFAELQQDYRCGGIKDKDFPQALQKTESIMGFDEFLMAVKQEPKLMVYLDIKLQPPLTASANDYAKAIFSRWEKHKINNPLFIEGPNAQAIQAYKQHGNTPMTTVLSYPVFLADENWFIGGALAAIKSFFHPKHVLTHIKASGADAVASPIQVINTRLERLLHNHHISTIVFTPNDQNSVNKLCKSRVDIMITDLPTLKRCQQNDMNK